MSDLAAIKSAMCCLAPAPRSFVEPLYRDLGLDDIYDPPDIVPPEPGTTPPAHCRTQCQFRSLWEPAR